MPPSLTPQAFCDKWRQAALKERAAAQSHFNDVCYLLGHPTPADLDPGGNFFTFEAGASKQQGGQGWADVWYKGRFAWEYKGKHANLDKAYQQLLQYREALENPPLLIVSDIDQIVIHTNFTNTVKRVETLSLDDLLDPQRLALLRAAFYNPEALKSAQTTQKVTEEAARQFARLAELLRKYGEDNQQIAHFLIRLLFCLFAEDVGLLPNALFTRLVSSTRTRPPAFHAQMGQLFAAMSSGGWFGSEEIPHFNGRLFDDAAVLELDSDGLEALAQVSELDWASIEPSIIGTLFERGLDPSKRSQLGAHYTSKEDILLIVEPVLMAPLRRKWEQVQAQARRLAERREQASARPQRAKLEKQLQGLLTGFAGELAQVQILDPACGSGNFLYVALRQLLDLEKGVINLAKELGVGGFFPSVSPAQLHGIEVNTYAHQLAQTTIWIGYIQWLQENGYGFPAQPILKPLDNIVQMDAILAYDEQGCPVEPEWPEVDVIIGNPPFLGGSKIRRELGDQYTDRLFALYEERIPALADLVCYWFEKARKMVPQPPYKRVGLLATNSIRTGVNRVVLDQIKKTGNIFMAWSDRSWVLEGAAVRVSIVGFDNGTEKIYSLDDHSVKLINSDLTSSVDVTMAQVLTENQGVVYKGMMKGGPFEIDPETAKVMLSAPVNPNGRSNSDVVKPYISGQDIVKKARGIWIVDFCLMSENEAALYELPFAYVKKNVKPLRDENKREGRKKAWWRFGEPNPTLRSALAPLKRCIVTPEVAKYRLFAWMPTTTVPDYKIHVFVRDDDYFLGVLQSRVHEVWSLVQGSWLGVGNDPSYSSSRTFGTFPCPWPPGEEPGEADDPRVQAIAQAARELVRLRDNWLNPPGASEADLKKRTLTNLYNQRPTWLANAHAALDRAVLAAYGWPEGLGDEQVLERLLGINLERAGGE